MDNWNPMEDAYHDKSFNSYDRGPGRNMPADPNERQMCTNLYIKGVPQALNEEGVRNLFSKYGNIKSCKIRRTPNYATNIAFVIMESVEQCSQAIHNLNGHKIGNDRMSVEFAKTQEEKERDRQEKERQEKLIRSLGSGRTVTNAGLMNNGPNFANLKISISNTGGAEACGVAANSAPPQRESNGQANGYASDTGAVSNGSGSGDRQRTSSDLKECEQCGKAGSSFKCAKCQVHYCSQACQARNWPTHKHRCKPFTPNTQGAPSNAATHTSPSHAAAHSSASSAAVQAAPPSTSSDSIPNVSNAPVTVQAAPVAAAAAIQLPLKKAVKVKLVEFQSPARFFVQLVDNVDLLRLQATLNQAIECSLYGLVPYKGGSWTDFAVQACTRLGLNTGDLYCVTCVNTSVGNQVMFSLPDGSDLGDKLVVATAALVDPLLKYTVWDSLHRKLSIGSALSVHVEPSSIEGADGFYAQVGNDELMPYIQAFHILDAHMTEYGEARKGDNEWNQTDNRRPVNGDHVLCLYEGSWSRAEVVVDTAPDNRLGVAFLDFGNLSLVKDTEVLNLPRHFSHMPAVAAKINVDGITDTSDESVRVRAKSMATELLTACTPVQAVVKDLSLDTLSVQITNTDGTDFGSTLMAANVVVKQEQPLEGSLILAATSAPSVTNPSPVKQTYQPITSPPRSTAPSTAVDSSNVLGAAANSPKKSPSATKHTVQTPSERVFVKPLLSPGKSYTVKLFKLDATQRFRVSFPQNTQLHLNSLSRELANFYSTAKFFDAQKPAVGDFVVFQHVPGEWRRGYVLKVSTANRVALTQHLDFEEETSKISFDEIRPLMPRFSRVPCQSHPVCQLEGVTDAERKKALLKPYMDLALEIEVLEYNSNVYTVRFTCDSQPHPQRAVRKYWMAGTDIPYVTLPTQAFEANLLHVVGPDEMYFTPAQIEEIKLCLNTIREQVSKVAEDAHPSEVRVGEVVFVYCSDYSEWDRAVVLEVLADQKLIVRSADFGSAYTETLANVRQLDEATARIPLRAIQCSLAGLKGGLTENSTSVVMLLNEHKVTVQVVGSSNGVVQVSMVDDTGANVVDRVNATCVPDSVASVAAAMPAPAEAAPVQSAPRAQPQATVSAEDQRLENVEAMLRTLQEEIASLRLEKARLQEERED